MILWELVIRCKVCGRKYPYQVSPEIYNEYENNVFFPIPCPKCKPQMTLDGVII